MIKTISILGCGWLGLPFGQYLIDKGWIVKGSTTTPGKQEQLRASQIKPYIIKLDEIETCPNVDFFTSEYLLINVPPSKAFRQAEAYDPLIDQINATGIKKVILVSSTSVYQSQNSTVAEESTDEMPKGANAILDIERTFKKEAFDTTIIRFGGLIGGQRYPGRFFKADSTVKGAHTPVNLIHLDDCIQTLDAVITQNIWGETINGVADTHPTKKEFYTLASQLKNRALPQFIEDESPFKIVSNYKLKNKLGVQLRHPDLMAMLKDSKLWKE